MIASRTPSGLRRIIITPNITRPRRDCRVKCSASAQSSTTSSRLASWYSRFPAWGSAWKTENSCREKSGTAIRASINCSAMRPRRIGERGAASVTFTPVSSLMAVISAVQRAGITRGTRMPMLARNARAASARVACSRVKSSSRVQQQANFGQHLVDVTDGKIVSALPGSQKFAEPLEQGHVFGEAVRDVRFQDLENGPLALPVGILPGETDHRADAGFGENRRIELHGDTAPAGSRAGR